MKFVSRTVAITCLAALVAGCGGSGGGEESSSGDYDKAKAKSLFESKCGSCHTLADAGTSGSVGPDLDGSAPDAQRVASQIEMGGGAMPPGLLTGKDKDLVAKYVADVAGE